MAYICDINPNIDCEPIVRVQNKIIVRPFYYYKFGIYFFRKLNISILSICFLTN